MSFNQPVPIVRVDYAKDTRKCLHCGQIILPGEIRLIGLHSWCVHIECATINEMTAWKNSSFAATATSTAANINAVATTIPTLATGWKFQAALPLNGLTNLSSEDSQRCLMLFRALCRPSGRLTSSIVTHTHNYNNNNNHHNNNTAHTNSHVHSNQSPLSFPPTNQLSSPLTLTTSRSSPTPPSLSWLHTITIPISTGLSTMSENDIDDSILIAQKAAHSLRYPLTNLSSHTTINPTSSSRGKRRLEPDSHMELSPSNASMVQSYSPSHSTEKKRRRTGSNQITENQVFGNLF